MFTLQTLRDHLDQKIKEHGPDSPVWVSLLDVDEVPEGLNAEDVMWEFEANYDDEHGEMVQDYILRQWACVIKDFEDESWMSQALRTSAHSTS